MARTSKSRGSAPFHMRSGNRPSPNKFLKGLKDKVVGAVGGVVNKVIGVGGQDPAAAAAGDVAGAGGIKAGAVFGGGGGAGMAPGLPGSALTMKSRNRPSPNKYFNPIRMPESVKRLRRERTEQRWKDAGVYEQITGDTQNATTFDGQAQPGAIMRDDLGGGGPMAKRGYTPYKKAGFTCPSPLKGADPVLVRGAYDAASGKGTTKYGMIAAARAATEIAKTTGQTFGYLAAQRKSRKEAEEKASLSYKKRQWKKNAKFEKWKERKGKGWKDKMRYA